MDRRIADRLVETGPGPGRIAGGGQRSGGTAGGTAAVKAPRRRRLMRVCQPARAQRSG